MRHWKSILILVLLGVLLVACGRAETGTPAVASNLAPTGQEDEQESISSDSTAESSISGEDIDSEAVLNEEEVVDECLSCHANQERLIETASEVEEVVNENSGMG